MTLYTLLASKLTRSAKWTAVLILGATVALVVLLTPSEDVADRVWSWSFSRTVTLTRHDLEALRPPSAGQDTSTDTNRHLHIFMPADSPHINLCKEIMSAVALGYPLPTLLNWEGEFNRPSWHFAGSHIAKLESLLSVIEQLLSRTEDPADPNDVALLVDAYDIWFQLPPSVLLRRFHQINQEADERVRQQWELLQADTGIADFPIPPPRQNIIVTSAKHCSPLGDSGSDPHYQHWPASPMPEDLYGESTDQVIAMSLDQARKYRYLRPRCVNSGFIMGTMGALRDALIRAKEKVEAVAREGRQLWSDQALFGEVIGDQEMWRGFIREAASRWNGTASELDLGILDGDVRRIASAALRGTTFEFGIGLDYNFTTIPPTCSAEEDGYFVKINDREAVAEESRNAGVPNDAVRVDGIPPELRESFSKQDPLSDVQWGDIPLYTDFFFGITPVGIHHNAYVDDLKPWRLKNWWDQMWFYPNLRELVTKNLKPQDEAASLPLAKVSDPHSGGQISYWPRKDDLRDKSVKVFAPATEEEPASFKSISWDSVCQKGPKPWYNELFGGGKGPLVV